MPRVQPIRTEAIVLRHRPLGDADRICVLSSPTRGRIEAVAKGVRRPLSKVSGHIQPLSRGQFSLARGRNLDIITEAQTLDAWPALHEDVDRMTDAIAIAELVDRSTDLDLAAQPTYELLHHSLATIATTGSTQAARWWFTIHLLDQQGYRTELEACVLCRVDLQPDGNGFSAADGGVVCPTCHRRGGGRRLSSPAFRLLRYMRRSSPEATAQVRVDADTAVELEQHLQALLEHSIDERLKSRGFANALAIAGQFGRSAANAAARERKERNRAAI